jgi:hypothetical protein
MDVWTIIKCDWEGLDKAITEWTKDEKSACIENDEEMNWTTLVFF